MIALCMLFHYSLKDVKVKKMSINDKIKVLNGERMPLETRLPLRIPLSISITTANVCNLKCEFCAISDSHHKNNKSFMELEEFKLFISRLNESKWHLKQIVLVGLGEPLLNKNIVDFIKIAKEANIADKIHLVSNGIFLSKKMSNDLIEAGLDILRISLNGLSGNDYEKYTNVMIDFEELYENLKYYYNTKKEEQKLYIKIMDYQVKEKEAQFYDMFERISDVSNIEFLTEMSTSMNYESITKVNKEKGLKGFETIKTDICPLPFYHIYCNADATISACCVAGPWYTPPALVFGDLHKNTFSEIWNGYEFNSFLLRMLEKGKNNAHLICKKCKAYLSYIYPEDIIKNEKNRICDEIKSKINR